MQIGWYGIMKERSKGVGNMTSKDVSFLSNIKKEKEGLNMVKTVQNYANKKEFECRKCGSLMKPKHHDYKFPYNIGHKEKSITIKNAPYYHCGNCDNKTLSVLLYADVDQLVEKEIFIRLNNRQEIPDEVNFSEFTAE